MELPDKQKKFSKDEILKAVDVALKGEPYLERLKEELSDHLDDQENFGQISGSQKTAEALGDPKIVAALCQSFLSRKKSRLALVLIIFLLGVVVGDFIGFNFVEGYPSFLSNISFILEFGLIIGIGFLLPSFRAKDLW